MPPSFYILDGHAQIYRAFYAPFRDLTSPSGEPTRATHVFCQMLFNLLRGRRPDYLAMAMDVSDATVFRCHLHPDYKAHRDPQPESLGLQAERIVSIVSALGVPIFRLEGFEADDLMATIAYRLREKPVDIYLVSRDKDLEQLISDRVRLYDVNKDAVLDAAALRATKGYTPDLAVEIQTLAGDSTDNVPGVVGVGVKTAAKLIGQYGSAQAVLEHADELTPKLAEQVKAFASQMPVTRELVTLRRDVPIDFDLDRCAVSGLDPSAVVPIFEELGFTRLRDALDQLIAEFGKTSPPRAPASPHRAPESSHRAPPFMAGGSDATPDSPETESRTHRAPPFMAGGSDATRGGPDTESPSHRAPTAPHRAPPFMAGGSDATPGGPPPGAHYELIDTSESLARFAAQLKEQKAFAFDTETTGLNPVRADLVGLSFCWTPGEAFYIPVRAVLGRALPVSDVVAALKPTLEDPAIAKIGQNAKYDMIALRQVGIEVAGLRFDTMLAAFLLDPLAQSHSLDALAQSLLGHKMIPIVDLIGKGKNQLTMDQVDTAQVCEYAAEDADFTFRLAQHLDPRITGSSLEPLFREVEVPLVEVLAEMEHNGIALDVRLLQQLGSSISRRIDELADQVQKAAGHPFNIDSTKQLAVVLFDEQGLPAIKKTKTGRSTDAETLEALCAQTEHPIPRLVLEYRELAKLKNTYVDTLPKMVCPRTGRIHAGFNQTGAITGRLSSSDPNLQNIPVRTELGRRIREAFVAGDDDSLLLTADYSQVELRLLAHFSKDEALLEAFATGKDIHRAVAAQVNGIALNEVTFAQRSAAKAVNFGIIYGQSAFGLSRSLGIPRGEAQAFIDTYFLRYPGIRWFIDECIAKARRLGYAETILGRRRPVPELTSRSRTQSSLGERVAVNTVVQGSAADLIKRAMIDIHQAIKAGRSRAKMLLQVHDELVFEVPADSVEKEAAMIRKKMETAMPLDVPIVADVSWGRTWAEGKA